MLAGVSNSGRRPGLSFQGDELPLPSARSSISLVLKEDRILPLEGLALKKRKQALSFHRKDLIPLEGLGISYHSPSREKSSSQNGAKERRTSGPTSVSILLCQSG